MVATSASLYKCLSIPPGSHKDLFELQAIRMVIIHNMIIRGVNSILLQANEITPETLESFMTYCLCFDKFVHDHHVHEEELYFIMLEEKMGASSMGHNVEGHEEFKKPFAAWKELCRLVKDKKASYNPEEFVAATRAFADVLVQHLSEEIDTITADQMRKYFSVDEMKVIEARMEAKVRADTSLIWDSPMHFILNEASTGGWFPPMPAPIKFVVRHVLMPLHSDVWAFGAADKNSILKLPYKEEEANWSS